MFGKILTIFSSKPSIAECPSIDENLFKGNEKVDNIIQICQRSSNHLHNPDCKKWNFLGVNDELMPYFLTWR